MCIRDSINSWLSALKDNKRLVFTASKDAQKIVDYTNKLNEEYQSDSESYNYKQRNGLLELSEAI